MLRTIMKKVNKVSVLCLALVLAWVFMLPGISKATDPRASIYELHVYKMRALTTDPVGEIDFAGTPVINFEATPNFTLLNSYTQLSTWQNAPSGASYYQASAGETIAVDPHAIYTSGGFGGGVVFSGVTIHAPLATEADNERIFKVEYVSSGATGYLIDSGTTVVYVHGAPSSGVTDFYYTAAGSNLVSGNNIQNLQTSAAFNGLTVADMEISDHGDSKTWRLNYNSAVSAWVIAETNL